MDDTTYQLVKDRVAKAMPNWTPSKGTNGSSAYGGWIDGTGDYNYYNKLETRPCHAFVQVDSGGLCVSLYSAKKAPWITPDVHRKFITWLMSDDCPYSASVLNRKDIDYILEGAVIWDGKTSSMGERLWLGKTMRHSYEMPWAVETWSMLVDNGIDPLIALAVANGVKEQGADAYVTHSCIHGTTFMHMPNRKSCVSIMKRDVKNKGLTSLASHFGCSLSLTEFFNGWQQKKAKEGIKDDGWGNPLPTVKDNNPLIIPKNVLIEKAMELCSYDL